MNKIKKLLSFIIGVIASLISKKISIRNNIVVFGGGGGKLFAENSKYMFEYYLKYSDNECWWVTSDYSVYKNLKRSGKPVLYNYHPLAIFKIQQAAKVIFCTSRNDILYVYSSNRKIIVNLFHGMPLKKIVYDYDGTDLKRGHLFDKLWNKYVAGYKWEDADITLSTSEYFVSVLKSAFRNNNIVVTGLPRNDYFFENTSSLDKKYFTEVHSKKIISYLPTYRNFGLTEQPTIPFAEDFDFRLVLEKHNALLIHKPHYNVKQDIFIKSDTIVEFKPDEIDVQLILKYSDILITDYSSCYIDYLLLNKPVIFYRYDNYTKDDTGLYSHIESLNHDIGPVCKTEAELKNEILKLLEGKDSYKESRNRIKKLLHKYTDGGYSKRVFDLIEAH
jgi:CDP-glycerol glycerophosphotransferase (TagB/SpsB family)